MKSAAFGLIIILLASVSTWQVFAQDTQTQVNQLIQNTTELYQQISDINDKISEINETLNDPNRCVVCQNKPQPSDYNLFDYRNIAAMIATGIAVAFVSWITMGRKQRT